MNLPKFLMFSGGQTSGYMLWREIQRVGIEEYNRTFKTLFCNTGKEHDKTLDFVHQVEAQWGVNITWLEYTRVPAREINPKFRPDGKKRSNLLKQQERKEITHWFRVVNYETAARYSDKETPFDVLLAWMNCLPNARSRACSGQLKIRTKCRFIHSLGIKEWDDYIGIRKDEEHRSLEILASPEEKGEHSHFPLCESGVTKEMVDAFWNNNSFKLEIPNHEGNCGGCFLKARWKRVEFARNNPKNAQWWADKEKEKLEAGVAGDGSRFQKGRTWEGIINEARQPNLFIDFSEEDVPCSCAVGGRRFKDDD